MILSIVSTFAGAVFGYVPEAGLKIIDNQGKHALSMLKTRHQHKLSRVYNARRIYESYIDNKKNE